MTAEILLAYVIRHYAGGKVTIPFGELQVERGRVVKSVDSDGDLVLNYEGKSLCESTAAK